jgi:hypothetical protein
VGLAAIPDLIALDVSLAAISDPIALDVGLAARSCHKSVIIKNIN